MPELMSYQFELSDFSLVNVHNGKGLRHTVTWRLEHPSLGLLGESISGCLVTRQADGVLKFSPPMSNYGPKVAKRLALVTEDYHNLVVRLVKESGWEPYIGNGLPEQFRAKLPHEIDPALPTSLSV